MAQRVCRAIKEGGGPCEGTPMRDGEYCFWHSPEHREEAQEARRLGGLRRRRESVVSGSYEIEGLGSAAEIRRLLEIAVTDTLSLENSIARARAIAYLAQTAIRLLETGELADRVDQLEAAMQRRRSS